MKFLSKVLELREVETQWLKKYFYTSVMITFVLWGAPNLVAVATFVTSMLMGVPLESGKVISALATFEKSRAGRRSAVLPPKASIFLLPLRRKWG